LGLRRQGDWPQPRWGCRSLAVHTQGSSFLATLGFETESRWDSDAPTLVGAPSPIGVQSDRAPEGRKNLTYRQDRNVMKKYLLLGWMIVGAAMRVGGAADGLSEALQKGLFEEEANHNLEAAIKAYQSVVIQVDQQRKLAATAVFRLGECYRKLGRTNEAKGQYERLLREFSDQTTLANLSRQNLGGLGAVPPAAVAKPSEAGGATDEEEKELQRIKAVIRDSPDLINAREQLWNRTPLHNAAQMGYLTVAQFLLANGADVEATDKNNSRPLHLAAGGGHKSLVELLLANHAAVDGKQNPTTPLHLAAANGHKLVVAALLGHGAKVNARTSIGWTPLHNAAVHGYRAVAEVLLQYKADVNAASTGSGSDSPSISFDVGTTPLHLAAYQGDFGMVEWLCANGANVNAQSKSGQTALQHAAGKTSNACLELLLAKNADVNVSNDRGTTPLLIAASSSNAEGVGLLLAHGAEVDRQDNQRSSPLHEAVGQKSEEVLKVLLTRKLNLEVRNKDGLTPLQQAVLNNRSDAAEMLLVAGADANVVYERDGKTPLHWAVERRTKGIAELLLAHKANVDAQDTSGHTPLDYVKINAFGPHPTTGDELLTREIGDRLRKAGAREDLQRLSFVTISRNGVLSPRGEYLERGWGNPWFYKGTNSFNRYTLLELISNFFENRQGSSDPRLFPFPDFAKVNIHRLKREGGGEMIRFNLEEVFKSADCSKDILLEWGDIVEVPELDHKINERWRGLDPQVVDLLKKCLERKVEILVKGEATKVTLRPNFSPRGRRDDEIRLSEGIVLPDFRLRDVVNGSNLLLSSSDVTRVKVKRKDPASGQLQELVFDLNQVNPRTDLWLHDGDVIEVPEK
jgi:ankyrin repeat protein